MIIIQYANVNEAERPGRENQSIDDSKWQELFQADNSNDAIEQLVEYLNDCDDDVDVPVIDNWFRFIKV